MVAFKPCCKKPNLTIDDSVEVRSESDAHSVQCRSCGQYICRISERCYDALEAMHRDGPAPAKTFLTPHLTRRLIALDFIKRERSTQGWVVALTPKGLAWCVEYFGTPAS